MSTSPACPSDGSPSESPFSLATPVGPPAYPMVPHAITWHGHTRFDPYYWMRGEKLFNKEADDDELKPREDEHISKEVESESHRAIVATLTPSFVVADSAIKAMLKAENAFTMSYFPQVIRPDDTLIVGHTAPHQAGSSSPSASLLSASASSITQALAHQSSVASPSSPLLAVGGFPALCSQRGLTPTTVGANTFPSLPVTTGTRTPKGVTLSSKQEVAAALQTPVSFLYKEMKARWKQTDSSTPARGGAYWYYSREMKGKEYHQVCRRKITDANKGLALEIMRARQEAATTGEPTDINVPFCPEEEEVIFDVNVLQEEMKLDFVEVMGPYPSPCDTKMVYAVDNSNGQEIFTLYVCDISPEILRAGVKNPRVPAKKPRLPGNSNGDSSDIDGEVPTTTAKRRFAGRGVVAKKFVKQSSSSDDDDGDAPPTTQTQHTVRANPPVVRTIELFDCTGEVSWVDCNIIAYTAMDDSQRSHRLVFHDLRLPQEEHLTDATHLEPSAGPASRHLNDVIVYEEKDPRFSVGGVHFLDDEQYASFGTSSKECEELFILTNMLSTADMYRTRAPVYQPQPPAPPTVKVTGKAGCTTTKKAKSAAKGEVSPELAAFKAALVDPTSSEEASTNAFLEATGASTRGRTIPQYQAAIQCIVPRMDGGIETDMECEAAHHPYLIPLGDRPPQAQFDMKQTGGFIFVANHKPMFSEFGVFYAPDTEVLSNSATTHIRNRWKQLVETKQFVTVQSIELVKDFLLLSCIDRGFPSCYICRMEEVRQTIASGSVLRFGFELKCVADALLRLKQQICSPTATSSSDEFTYCTSAEWGTSDFVQCHSLTAAVSHLAEKSQAYEINLEHLLTSLGSQRLGSPTPKEAAYGRLYDATVAAEILELVQLGLLHPLPADDPVGVVAESILKREEVMANGIKYDASMYASERLWAPATESVGNTDGQGEKVSIPITLTYRKDKFVPGESPILLYLYGSYGDCTDPEFNRNRLSLVDRGVAFGIVSVRGGGELGRGWRDAGRMSHRLNSVLDLISATKFLRGAPVTATWRPNPSKIAIMGGSAGGTVVAAAANREPELFSAVLADVPFVDCLTSMLDDRIPLTTVEWDEWGNPVADPVAYKTILEYSPQDNIPGYNELVLTPFLAAAQQAVPQEEGTDETASAEVAPLEVLSTAKRLWKAQPVLRGSIVPPIPQGILSPDVERRVRGLPAVYVSSGLGDSRVAFWEPMAYVAKLRAVTSSYQAYCTAHGLPAYQPPLILHYCELSGGHGGASGRFAYLKDIAREYAFLLRLWDIPLLNEH